MGLETCSCKWSAISVNGHLPKPSGNEQDLKGGRKAGYGRRNAMEKKLEPGLHGYPCPWEGLPGFFSPAPNLAFGFLKNMCFSCLSHALIHEASYTVESHLVHSYVNAQKLEGGEGVACTSSPFVVRLQSGEEVDAFSLFPFACHLLSVCRRLSLFDSWHSFLSLNLLLLEQYSFRKEPQSIEK